MSAIFTPNWKELYFHQTWPLIRTDAVTKPIDLLMVNRLKESFCQIKVLPMGLFYPMSLVPDVYPPPPRPWFSDCEDMLEETWDFPKRTDVSDGYFPGSSGYFPMWENYPIFQTKPKKEDNIGLVDAIMKSILSTWRMDLQRKLFCSMQLE